MTKYQFDHTYKGAISVTKLASHLEALSRVGYEIDLAIRGGEYEINISDGSSSMSVTKICASQVTTTVSVITEVEYRLTALSALLDLIEAGV